jgi:hypothetical protein
MSSRYGYEEKRANYFEEPPSSQLAPESDKAFQKAEMKADDEMLERLEQEVCTRETYA